MPGSDVMRYLYNPKIISSYFVSYLVRIQRRGSSGLGKETYASGTWSGLNMKRWVYIMPADKPPKMVPKSGATRYLYMPKATAGAIVRAGLILAAQIYM